MKDTKVLTLGTVTPGLTGYPHTHAQVHGCTEDMYMSVPKKYACGTNTQLDSYQSLENDFRMNRCSRGEMWLNGRTDRQTDPTTITLAVHVR